MGRVLIVSDDLTGAADAASAFTFANMRATVTLTDAGVDGHAEVLAIDANTRALDAVAAFGETLRIFSTHARSGDLLFKKVDSLLRGHLSSEIAAALQAARERGPSKRTVVILAPAFPEQGRTTADGFQWVHGPSLAENGRPIRQGGHIPSLISEAGLRCATVERKTIQAGAAVLESAMTRMAELNDVLVCDAETDADLASIVGAGMSLGERPLWAGSSGLAHQLARALPVGTRQKRPSPSGWAAGPTLFVVGSPSSTAKKQMNRLSSAPGVIVHRISPAILSAGDRCSALNENVHAVRTSLESGSDALVTFDCEGAFENEDPLLSAALAGFVAPCVELAGALVACGGATARSVLLGLGTMEMQVITEVESGVVFSLVSYLGRSLPVITKAGAFGGEETLVRCADFLRQLTCGAHAPQHSVSGPR